VEKGIVVNSLFYFNNTLNFKVFIEKTDMSGIDNNIYDHRLNEPYNRPQRVDQVSATFIYIGWVKDSRNPVDETESFWKIKRIQQIGSVWYMEYANGNGAFDNVWADRALLQYS
jgi:hypothetical protein